MKSAAPSIFGSISMNLSCFSTNNTKSNNSSRCAIRPTLSKLKLLCSQHEAGSIDLLKYISEAWKRMKYIND